MNLIAIVDKSFGIAKNGKQIIYIPDDLKHFKSLTLNKTVILGRKTLTSFPNSKPLSDRTNFILSHNKDFIVTGATIFNSINELISHSPSDAFVIGGESVYRELLPYCDTAYITLVDYDFKADKFLPNLVELDWKKLFESEIMEYNGYRYSYITFIR